MKQITQQFKDEIKAFGKQIDSKITYNIEGNEYVLGKTELNSITPSFEGAILKSVMKKLVVDSNVEIPAGTIIKYEFGVLTDKTNDTYEYINYGDYVVKDIEVQEDTNSYILTCYDKMLYAMKEYQAFINEYPITIREYIDELAKYLQLDFKNREEEFVNYNLTIPDEKYLDSNGKSLDYTYRDVLDELAQATASTICINENNQLEIRYINEATPIPTRPSKNILDESQSFVNGYISASNVFTPDNKTALYNQYIEVEGGKTYTFSTNARVDNMVISMYDSSDTFLGRQKVSNTTKITQAMGNNVAYVRYAINYNNSATMTQEILDSLEVMIEEGSNRTTPYEKYGPVVMGKNLLDTSSYQKGYIDDTGNYISDDYYALFEQYIPVEAGEKYCFSMTWAMSDIRIITYNENKEFVDIVSAQDELKKYILVNNNEAYVRLCFADGYDEMTDELIEEAQLMFEIGLTRTSPYEPYIPPAETEIIDERNLKDINVKFGEKYGPINSIVLSRASGSDNIYLQDTESVEANGLCEIKISDNQLMNDNNRADFLPGILEQLDGLEYYINDYTSTGITYLELCDRYNVKIDQNEYPCIMFNDEVLIAQGIEENIYTETLEESGTDYTKADKTDRKINQTYIIADKQQGEIEALTSKTEELVDSLGNYYTKEQIERLVINAETGLTNTFSEAGGNNIMRNTGLWFANTEDDSEINPYEFWTGKVVKLSEDKASNHNALLLQNDTLYQEQQVPNGNYSVSFKYKKLEPLSSCYVIINDISYELTQDTETEFYTGMQDSDGNYITQPLVVNAQNIKIQFTSDMDNACEVYDLMVNAGNVKLAYSQNQNETTTDTVNISKGITITSSNTDTTFRANSDGIRTLDNNGNELAKFTDKGMNTKEIVVREKSEISGILIQEIGDQTWLTKI